MLAWVGGGSAALGGTILGATAASGLMSATAARNAGIAQSNDMKYQAYVEGLSAKQQEIDRRRSLLRALASANAAAGAGGIETSGSFGGIVRQSIKDNTNDLLIGAANASAKQQTLSIGARNARAAGNTNAALSLLDTTGKIAGML
jgi:hypothetical protein